MGSPGQHGSCSTTAAASAWAARAGSQAATAACGCLAYKLGHSWGEERMAWVSPHHALPHVQQLCTPASQQCGATHDKHSCAAAWPATDAQGMATPAYLQCLLDCSMLGHLPRCELLTWRTGMVLPYRWAVESVSCSNEPITSANKVSGVESMEIAPASGGRLSSQSTGL